MLRPVTSCQNMDGPALLEAVAQRDASIAQRKVSEIKLLRRSSSHNTALIDDEPQPMDMIAKYLGAPAPFLASADLILAQQIVDHQFKKVKDKKELVFKNGKAIGSQPAASKRIMGLPVAEKLVKAVGGVRRANMDDMGSYVDITIVGDKVTMKPKLNDITEGGVRCLYSELLTRKPTIEPYAERLVCTNGMICKELLQTIEFENMDQFLNDILLSVENATAFVDKTIRAQLQKAAETKVERSEQALRQIFEANRVNPKLLSPTIAALMVEDDGSAYGVLQAITRSANSAGYVHRVSMQQIGAREMARLETVHCPTCWASSMAH